MVLTGKNCRRIGMGMILPSLLVGVCVWPQMPERMAFHWNVKGQVDGFAPKFMGLLFMPAVSIALFLLFVLLPGMDPLKKNIEKFRAHYERFMVVMIAFLFYIYLLTIIWNAGVGFNIVQFLSPAFGMLFYCTGILVGNARRNWFIGIRNPWTLSSESVWNRTHKLGGRLFKIAGGLAFLGVLFQGHYAMLLVLVPAVLAGVYLFAYSYLEYRKINGKRKKGV